MLQEADRSLTLDEMMEAIRQEIRQRRANDRSGGPLQAGSPPVRVSTGLPANAADWNRIEQNLGVAEQFAPIANLPPQFVDWGKYRRMVALGMARGVMYFSRFITNKQSRFNESLLAAVRELTTHARGLMEREAELASVLKGHEARMRELHTSVGLRLEDLVARIAGLESRRDLEEKIASLQQDLAATRAELAALAAASHTPPDRNVARTPSAKPSTRSRKR